MSKRKYTKGEQITSLADFEKYKGLWFVVRFGSGEKTLHRGFVESWQLRMLKWFIYKGQVFQAKETAS